MEMLFGSDEKYPLNLPADKSKMSSCAESHMTSG